ncbi:MAG TPA: ATP-binding cassette domain-containing protein [Solirubrobacteraceae bacterium]|jgi:predicted ABC-type transport system involved in lysophospholipase L1 biosynthesis ATPase subunit|nr:ATP-binding cassette domain-containing protein [Solirubrobacteraceae bacterium]
MVGVGSEPMLVLSGVCQGLSHERSKRWRQVLSDVSLNVEAGEVVAVIGGRLAGKTTLLRIAAGLVEPEAGRVRLDQFTLTDLSERERGTLRGREIVWLNTVGMSAKLRVSKIVGWSLADCQGRGERERRVAEGLERVGATDCVRLCWGDLSRFEQVLVAYAQAFASRPRIIVIDDLLDGLGEPWTREASDLLRSLINDAERSCGVLMSASDRDSSLYADRVWVLENGSLIPTAGHREGAADILVFRRRRAAADE